MRNPIPPDNPSRSKQALFDLFTGMDDSPVLQEWDLAELRDHEEILAAVPKHTDDELAELRKGVSEFGLLGALDVLPDKRILDGHGRRAVLVRHFPLISKVQVRVHKDLADDPDRQLLFGITAGLARRQLDEAARLRLATARYEIESRLAQVRKAEGQRLGGLRSQQKANAGPTRSDPEPASGPLGGNIASKRPKAQARDAAAKVAGKSGSTFQKIVTLKKENAPAQRLVDAGLPPESAKKLHQHLRQDTTREAGLVDKVLAASPESRKKELRTILGQLKAEAEDTKKAGEAVRPVNNDKETDAYKNDLKNLIEPLRVARINEGLVVLAANGGHERVSELADLLLKASKVLGGMHATLTAHSAMVANPTTKTEAGPAGKEAGRVA